MLHTMYFADEVRDFSEIDKGKAAKLKPGELELAERLIDELSNDEFKPEQYQDEYRDRVLDVVNSKVEGKEITAAAPQAQRTQVIDLMDALKQSLAKRAGAARRGPPRRARRRPAKKPPVKAPRRAASSGQGGQEGPSRPRNDATSPPTRWRRRSACPTRRIRSCARAALLAPASRAAAGACSGRSRTCSCSAPPTRPARRAHAPRAGSAG